MKLISRFRATDDQMLDDEEVVRYLRSPVDVLHAVVFSALAGIAVLVTAIAEEAVLAFEEDLVRLVSFLTPSVERVLAGLVEWMSLVVAVGVLAIPFITRRYRLLGYVLAAAWLPALLMVGIHALLDRGSSAVLVNEVAERAGISVFPDNGGIDLAPLAAVFVVLAPFVSRPWRRAGAAIFAGFVAARILVASHLPAEIVIAVPLGAACGALVLLAFGRPDRRPTVTGIRRSLVAAGLVTNELHPAHVDARGSTPYLGTLDDGTPIFVKVLSGSERAADLLFRTYRYLLLKNVGDDRPFSSLRRTVEHEALVSLMARDIGVPTPRLRAVANAGGDSMMLAYDAIDGRSLDGLSNESVTDDLMRSVWGQVKMLRDRRIAHRDLRRANIFVGGDGSAYLIDFGFSELAVTDSMLDADVAQMLASFVVVASPDRVVRTATEVMGRDIVGGALGRLQMKALSGATQTALKAQKGLLGQLQHEVMEQCDVPVLEFEPIQRVNAKNLLTLGLLAGVVYFLVPQFSDLPGIVNQVKDANWAWAPLIVVASLLTYAGATVSLAGAIPEPLPSGPLFAAQVGSSFASKLAPAGLGGMALNIRFLQKHGVDESVAVSGVGLNSVVGFIGHMSLVAIFFVWAGRDAFASFHLPDPKWFVVGTGVALAIVAAGLVLRPTRRVMLGKIWPIFQRSLSSVGQVLRTPVKFALLLGGSAAVTFSYLLSLFVATQAFGGGLAFATVGAVYLVGAVVASAAPTPGGLGAMEAALIAGLVGAGLDKTIAVPAVFLYRLATFWLPILPGWLCFRWLQRREHI